MKYPSSRKIALQPQTLPPKPETPNHCNALGYIYKGVLRKPPTPTPSSIMSITSDLQGDHMKTNEIVTHRRCMMRGPNGSWTYGACG